MDGLFPKDIRTNEIKNEINDIKKWESKINRKYLKYEIKSSMIFRNMITIRSSGDNIYTKLVWMKLK